MARSTGDNVRPMRNLTLLGPQRRQPDLARAFDRHDSLDGPVAAITAGWQEREGENDELQEHLGRPVLDLKLHQRLERVFLEDPELFEVHRARQDHLRALQRLYRYRLDFFMEPARELLRRREEPEILKLHQQEALDALRQLDARHLEHIRQVHADFETQHQPLERPAIQRQRQEIQTILSQVSALAIAGGHVAVLVNRMRLFGITELSDHLPVFAWSAGAMALADRLVLFHDSPPQGAGNAEVLDVGLGWYDGVLPLPHAAQRLRLDDPLRVALFARRFAPQRPVPLHPGVVLECIRNEGAARSAWHPQHGATYLSTTGQVVPFEGSDVP